MFIDIVHLNGERKTVEIVSYSEQQVWIRWSALCHYYEIKLFEPKYKGSRKVFHHPAGTLLRAPCWKVVDIELLRRMVFEARNPGRAENAKKIEEHAKKFGRRGRANAGISPKPSTETSGGIVVAKWMEKKE